MASRRSAHQRGATLVEYALVVAVLAFGSLAAITSLEDESEDYYERSASDIGTIPPPELGGTSLPPPPTTAPPSTAAPPSTTAPPPTTSTTTSTTTTTTTTTTTPAAPSIVEWISNESYAPWGSYYWTARAQISIEDTTGANISGAQVTTVMVADNGSSVTRTCTTDYYGRCFVSWSDRRWWHSPVRVTVTDVDADPTWDGTTKSRWLWQP